jgi:hypothetical protein
MRDETLKKWNGHEAADRLVSGTRELREIYLKLGYKSYNDQGQWPANECWRERKLQLDDVIWSLLHTRHEEGQTARSSKKTFARLPESIWIARGCRPDTLRGGSLTTC